jgi:hypothetical protein
MKEFALKIFRNPTVRKYFVRLLLAIAAAAGLTQVIECTPAQLERADSALDEAEAAIAQARCAREAAESFQLLSHPELAAIDEAPAIAAKLQACFKPAPSASDAGAQ